MRLLRGLLGLVLLGSGGWAAAQEPKADAAPRTQWPYAFSKETTRVTKPVRRDGIIDYVEAHNAQWSQGVTNDNNAAIPLLDGFTARDANQRAHYARIREKLGVPAKAAPADADAGDPADGAPPDFEKFGERAWVEQDSPETARWLEAMGPRLDRVLEASKRERYYMPLVRTREDDFMASILLPHLNEMRHLAQALRARAMLRLGREDGEGFRRDAVAVVRFGRLAGAGPTMIEKLVAFGCESIGLEAIKTAATGGWLPEAQAQAILADLRAAPAPRPVHESFDTIERGFLLEFLQYAAVHGVTEAEKMLKLMAGPQNNAGAMEIPNLNPMPRDWNAALRKANGWFDRMVDAGRKPTYAQRKVAADAIEADIAELRQKQAGLSALVTPLEDRVIAMLISSTTRAYDTEARLEASRRLAELAVALSAHRSGTGQYPEELKQLVPIYYKSEPTDPFTDQPVVYLREGEGYTARCLGPRGGARTPGNELMIRVQQ